MRSFLLIAFSLAMVSRATALEFETGSEAQSPSKKSSSWSQDTSVPALTDVGDVPAAQGLLLHEMRTDVRFYAGGGVLTKLNLGIFSRFSLGAALNVPNLIGTGPISMAREDASVLARLLVLREDEAFPAIAIGWDGPAYAGGELRGLYLVFSKELRLSFSTLQAHGGLNSSVVDGFEISRNLRGFAAVSTNLHELTLFIEGDEFNHPVAPRVSAGARYFFDPVSVGVEFRDLGGLRNGVEVSRTLRVSYSGLF